MAKKTAMDCVSDGLDLFAAGKLHEAAASYKQAIQLEESFVEAHLGLAKALEMMGALDEAIAALQRAAETCPTEPFVHTSLSQCFQKKGMIREAEDAMALSMQLQRRH